jgi:hypothetical protein
VSLKLLDAEFRASGSGEAEVESIGRGRGRIFAHLKLRADPIDDDALRTSPTLQKLAEQPDLVERVRAALERAARTLSDSVLL